MRRLLVLTALLFALPAHADLIDRGYGLIYDTDLDITWLQDANYAQTSGLDSDGWMTWLEAVAWVDTLTQWGFSDWRLPETPGTTGPGIFFTTEGEMGHLFAVELGNTDPSGCPPPLNTGPFVHVEWEYGLTSPNLPPSPDDAWFFNLGSCVGRQFPGGENNSIFAWPVHEGDIGVTIPEPCTALLLAAGLAWLAMRRR